MHGQDKVAVVVFDDVTRRGERLAVLGVTWWSRRRKQENDLPMAISARITTEPSAAAPQLD